MPKSGVAGFCGRKLVINLTQLQTLQPKVTKHLHDMHNSAIAAQALWEKSTTFSLDLRHTPGDEIHT